MPTNPALPISALINVQVSLTQPAAQAESLNTMLVLGTSTVIDVVQRMRVYDSLAAVATDFGTSAPEYLAAVLWFEQAPQPTQLSIGRWVNAASAGQLIGGALTATQQVIATWNAITTGDFHVSIDGVAKHITALNFSAATNMNGVAAIIQTGLQAATASTLCVWNAEYENFVITSPTTGTSSTISFVTAGGTTDISVMMVCTNTPGNGCYEANGLAAETALAAVQLFDLQFGGAWYGLTVLGSADADSEAIAPYIEADTVEHFFGVSTQEAGVLVGPSTSDIAYILSQAAYTKTAVQYSSTNPYAVVSLLGRILTVNWNGNSTAIALMYKQEPGIIPELLNATQMAAVLAKNANVFVAYNNNTAIIQPGTTTATNVWIDDIIGIAWLAVTMQTALYNALYTTPTKIPQTDAGNQILSTIISGVCSQGVANGLLAPGTWNSAGFGSLLQGAYLSAGFYVYAPPIATQSEALRVTRVSVPFQVACKLAGAVQSIDVSVIVNQ